MDDFVVYGSFWNSVVGLLEGVSSSRESRYTFETTRGLLATDHIILNHSQVTWTTPELPPSSPSYPTNRMTFQSSTDLTCIAALHGGPLMVLGSNSLQGELRSDTYTTRLTWPHLICRIRKRVCGWGQS
ncbi:hypothetical protein TNCV_771141 [Trichonephila clavipes]|nr:hypothetical protein TNCV_771141 [Trichonephila clavipes]